MIVPIPKDVTGLEITAPEYNCYGIVDSVDSEGNAMVTAAGSRQQVNASTLQKLATKFPKGEPLWGGPAIAWTVCNPSDLIISDPEGICWSGWANFIDKKSISIDPAVYHKGVAVKYLGISYQNCYLILAENKLGWANQSHFTQPQTTNEPSPLETMLKIKKPEEFTPGCVGSIAPLASGTPTYLKEDDGSMALGTNLSDSFYGIVCEREGEYMKVKYAYDTRWFKFSDVFKSLSKSDLESMANRLGKQAPYLATHACIDTKCLLGDLKSNIPSYQTWPHIAGNCYGQYENLPISTSSEVIHLATTPQSEEYGDSIIVFLYRGNVMYIKA